MTFSSTRSDLIQRNVDTLNVIPITRNHIIHFMYFVSFTKN